MVAGWMLPMVAGAALLLVALVAWLIVGVYTKTRLHRADHRPRDGLRELGDYAIRWQYSRDGADSVANGYRLHTDPDQPHAPLLHPIQPNRER